MEAIILAGGLGTRLRSAVVNMPKSMALVYGEPFLNYQLRYLKSYGISKVVLAVGYLREVIMNYYHNHFEGIDICYSIEDEPLGTGGAIALALKQCSEVNVLVLNGDTMMMFDINDMMSFHLNHQANVSITLKKLNQFDRYGSVVIGHNDQIIKFEEKKWVDEGWINSGCYIIHKNWLLSNIPSSKFSFEKDILESYIDRGAYYGYKCQGYFIDIGIPEDYHRAQADFARLFPIDVARYRHLFLDRDGVINRLRPGDYVKRWSEFEFLPGVLTTLAEFSRIFTHIFIVTNQQGVAKGILSLEDLENIHQQMKSQIEGAGGRIDAIYAATDLDSPQNFLRKPNIGMAYLAQKDFPSIKLQNSIMIGDSSSDIQFGKAIGAYTIRIQDHWDPMAHKTFKSIYEVVSPNMIGV